MRIRPAAREQRPVPTTNRLRLHEKTAPPLTGKYPGQCGQEHPIGWAAVWPAHLPAEHREFVTPHLDDVVRLEDAYGRAGTSAP